MLKGPLLSQGNTAEVFAWSDTEILKLYRAGFDQQVCIKEFIINKELEKIFTNIPRANQQIYEEGRVGIVYERIMAPTLLELTAKKCWNAGTYGKEMAKIHFKMHQKEVNSTNIPAMKKVLNQDILEAIGLTTREKELLNTTLDQLPSDNKICHFDFHPNNIMYDKTGGKVIDWTTCCIGNPLADIAKTSVMLEYGVIPRVPDSVNLFFSIPKKRLNYSYLKEYRKLSGVTQSEIDAWVVVIMASRLKEWLPEKEKQLLLKEIRQRLN